MQYQPQYAGSRNFSAARATVDARAGFIVRTYLHLVAAVFAFVFLVALGVDYNIFLVSRIREEADAMPMRPAVLRALETTGGVITSAGLILAGTFLVLMTLPLEALFQLGFGVALGVLIDTFVVRTLLVPALAVWIGDRSWWPGRVPDHAAPPSE